MTINNKDIVQNNQYFNISSITFYNEVLFIIMEYFKLLKSKYINIRIRKLLIKLLEINISFII